VPDREFRKITIDYTIEFARYKGEAEKALLAASDAVIPAVSKKGIVRDRTADDNIAVQITNIARQNN
jgi:uncharacterized protein YccT (UPF0319 family)